MFPIHWDWVSLLVFLMLCTLWLYKLLSFIRLLFVGWFVTHDTWGTELDARDLNCLIPGDLNLPYSHFHVTSGDLNLSYSHFQVTSGDQKLPYSHFQVTPGDQNSFISNSSQGPNSKNVISEITGTNRASVGNVEWLQLQYTLMEQIKTCWWH